MAEIAAWCMLFLGNVRGIVSCSLGLQVYNGVAGPFVMPPFATAAGTPLYNVAGLRPVKMEGADW